MDQRTAARLSPRDIANETEAHVVSLPRKMLAQVVFLSLASAHDDDAFSTEHSEDLAALNAAQRYLSTTFEEAFAATAGSLSPALSTAHENLLSALNDTLGRLPAPSHSIEQSALLDLAKRAGGPLASAVAEFLSELFNQVVEVERASAKRAQDFDRSALAEIDIVAKKIGFVAVNASVEAARVGDGGRAFAVIATEIRDLAEQSKAAVTRIRAALT